MRYEVPSEPASGATVATAKREYVRTELGWEDTEPRRSPQGFSWKSLVLRYSLTQGGRDVGLPAEPPIGTTLYGKGRAFTRYADGWTDDPGMGRYEWGVLLWDMGPLSDEP